MNKFNPDMHHRRSVRLRDYDYMQEGLYFVTICVQNRECLFGEITDGEMILNEMGQIAERICNELPQRFNNAHLEIFVIMPNHFHAIVEITDDVPCCRGAICKGAINRAPTTNGGFAHEKNPMFYINLSRIVRWLKGRISFECRKINPDFAWQRSFHDHIIRNHNAHATIANYIENNPVRWDIDCFNKPRKGAINRAPTLTKQKYR
jgi:REP element-mobilizing transposase RayT